MLLLFRLETAIERNSFKGSLALTLQDEQFAANASKDVQILFGLS